MNVNKQSFDIIIAGGGLSGTLSALSLSQLRKANGEPLSIAIIEAVETTTKNNSSESVQAQATQASAFDARVLALSHGSMQYLKSLSLWHELKHLTTPIKNIHISDRGYYGKARMYSAAHDVSALGFVIEMSQLGKALITTLNKHSNITWFCPDSIKTIDWEIGSVNVQLASEQILTAELLLACDGGQSICRQFANISSTTKVYQQSAIIANVSMSKPHNNRAFERFTENGPIAMLPLNDSAGIRHESGTTATENRRCSLVWTLNSEQAEQIAKMSDQEFSIEFEQAFGSWLGHVTQAGKRTLFPLSLVQADEQIYHRMVLVGNASHTLHPIAGQGFNLGLRDVEQLTKTIANAIKTKQSFSSLAALTQYAKQRKTDHQQVIALTDSLVTLFSNQLPPLVAGRNIGLKVLNYLTPLKKAFADKTMGY